jgi:triosephosphate isomerase
MNTLVTEGYALAETLASQWKGQDDKLMILAPPFTHLMAVQSAVNGAPIKIAAQNCHWAKSGAYTGEISPAMLRAMGIEYVIIGHSERRELFGETNEIVRKKVDVALAEGLKVIFCCGESLPVRNAYGALNYVGNQLKESLLHLSADQMQNIIIAYEPIWAIGTGVTATADQAQEMHAFIRKTLTDKYDRSIAEQTTILYGGSVKGSNAGELFGKPDVDGGLVGGASLSATEFLQIAGAL